MDKVYKHAELTGKIIGCAINVHRTLGKGYKESVYQQCLEKEFQKAGVPFTKEHTIPIYYNGDQVGSGRVDFFVDEKVMVELKALSALDDAHLQQTLNYLESAHLEIALLFNFGAKRLQFRRLINSKIP